MDRATLPMHTYVTSEKMTASQTMTPTTETRPQYPIQSAKVKTVPCTNSLQQLSAEILTVAGSQEERMHHCRCLLYCLLNSPKQIACCIARSSSKGMRATEL